MRRTIGKKLRFEVFERDQFTCVYCGAHPPEVRLEIDHVIPVAENGSSSEDNLVTSCAGCNSGKGKKKLSSDPLPETEIRRRAQEKLERELMAKAEMFAIEAERQLRQEVVNWFCEVFGFNGMGNSSVSRLCTLQREFGVDTLTSWFEIAHANLGADAYEVNIIKYINGIARNVRGQQEAARNSG